MKNLQTASLTFSIADPDEPTAPPCLSDPEEFLPPPSRR